MLNKRKLALFAVTGALVAATLVGGLPALTQTAMAAPSTPESRGWVTDKPGTGSDTYLAEALGITTEQLSAAVEKARLAAIQQALDKGLITQAQADALRNNQRLGGRGRLGFFVKDADIDSNALLAQALGITVEKLEQARVAANDARLAQAVKDGKITQEQADLMKAQRALRDYIAEKDFFGSAVQQAVKDGVITQAQANAILNQAKGKLGFGRGDFGLFGGRGHH